MIHTTNSQTELNFASIAAQENTTGSDQAIVLNSIEGVAQKEYTVGEILSPKNISVVSRISNNRFCLFLTNKLLVDSLVEKTKFIMINDKEIQIYRLI